MLWIFRRCNRLYSAEEFIAAITQHIPKKNFQMVRYYGWYSNKSRGMRAKIEIEGDSFNNSKKTLEERILDVSKHRSKNSPSLTWRESSRPKELPLQPLTEPYVRLSPHTALIV